MRGRQVAMALQEKGWDVEMRTGLASMALRDVKDAIIVCVKSFPSMPKGIEKRNNQLVYDAIDRTSLRRFPKGMQAVIAGTQDMQQRFAQVVGQDVRIKTIYHHADPALEPAFENNQELKLVYVGEPESSKFLNGQLPMLSKVSFKQNPNWRQELRQYNAHFSARLDIYKSVIKLANVAALEAVYFTGKEPGVVELLGEDYPFYFRDPSSLKKVRSDIEHFAMQVGQAEWFTAKTKIAQAQVHLTLSASVAAYESLFETLSAR